MGWWRGRGGSGEDSLGCCCAKMGDGAVQLDDVATDIARSSYRILQLQRSQILQFFDRALAIENLAQFFDLLEYSEGHQE